MNLIHVFNLKKKFVSNLKDLALLETLSRKEVFFTITNPKIDFDIFHMSPLEDKEAYIFTLLLEVFLKQIYLKKKTGFQIFVTILLFHMILLTIFLI